MNIRNAQIDDVNRVSELMLQVAKIHSSARRDIFKEKNIEEIKNEVNNRMNNKENILIAEENNSIFGVIIYKIKEVREHKNLKDRTVLWIDELVVDELFVPLQALRSERRIKVDNNVLNFFIFVSFTSSIYK